MYRVYGAHMGRSEYISSSFTRQDSEAVAVLLQRFGVMQKIVSSRSAHALGCAAVHFVHPDYYR